MPNYQFNGPAPRFYPQIVIAGFGSLIAFPGDVWDLDEAPADGLWTGTGEPVTDHAGHTWPAVWPPAVAPEPEAPGKPVRPASPAVQPPAEPSGEFEPPVTKES